MRTIMGERVSRHEGAPSLASIAWGLSRAPRFAGHTTAAWTVGHHSIVAYEIAERVAIDSKLSYAGAKRLMLSALLHDAHEAVTADVPTEFKTPAFKAAQKAIDHRLWASLGLSSVPGQWHDVVAQIDERALLAEAYVMTPRETFARIALETALVPGTSRCPYEPDNAIVSTVHRNFGSYDPFALQYHLNNLMGHAIQLVKQEMV